MNEKRFGKEQTRVLVDKLWVNVPLSFYGDPVAGTTAYAICIYDAANAPVTTLRVNRPHAQCGTSPCWKIANGNSYKYVDRQLTASGVLQLQLKSGAAGVGRFFGKAKNNLAKGHTAMPIGVSAKLTGNRSATVQLMSSNGGCVSGIVSNVSEASPQLFNGKN